MPAKGTLAGVLLLVLTACAPHAPTISKADAVSRGDALMEKKQYRQAVAAYRAAVGVDPRDGQVRMKLATAYSLAGNGEAAKEAGRAADLLPGSVDAQLLAASLLLAQRSFFDASERAAAVLHRDPENVKALLIWANAKALLWSPALALDTLDEAERLGRDYERARHNLRPLVAASDDEAAEAALRKAVRLAPANPDTQTSLANFLWAVGRADEAEQPLKIWADGPSDNFPSRVLGVFYLSRHRDAEGETYLKAAVTRGDRDARLVLSDYYSRSNRYQEALAVLEPMQPTDDASGAVSLRVATIDFRSGKRNEAISRLDQLLGRQPNNVPALLLKAQILEGTEQWDQAQRAARVALQANPESSEAHATLGRILSTAGDFEGAFKELSEALRLSPDSGDLPLPLAQLSLNLGRDEEALQFAREAKRRHSDDPQASLTLVKAMIRTRDYPGANLELRPLVAHAPSTDVLLQQGTVQAALNDAQAARATFTRILETNRDSLEALSGLVSLDLKGGGVADARQRVDQALAAHPKSPGYLLLAASVYAAQNDMVRTQQTLRQVLAIDPANVGAAVALADALSRQRQAEAAINVLEQLLERRPQSFEARTALGRLLEQAGRIDEARAQYEKVVAQNPRAAKAAYRLAAIYVDQTGNLNVALNLASSAKQRLPNDPDVTDTLGWVYVGKNQISLALGHLREAVRAVPDNPVYRYHLGFEYLRSGDLKNAEAEFQRALQIDPKFRFAAQTNAALASMRR